jgi:hypothetical protein
MWSISEADESLGRLRCAPAIWPSERRLSDEAAHLDRDLLGDGHWLQNEKLCAGVFVRQPDGLSLGASLR